MAWYSYQLSFQLIKPTVIFSRKTIRTDTKKDTPSLAIFEQEKIECHIDRHVFME